jgi:hypothetical protein
MSKEQTNSHMFSIIGYKLKYSGKTGDDKYFIFNKVISIS